MLYLCFMPKVSIIVPVFNAQEYVTSCMESLLGQSLNDLEIIIVDDGGTDNSIPLIKGMADAYSGPKRFVFAQTDGNAGPGVARNIGMSLATGDYIAFLDSDDLLDAHYCETLFRAACCYDADISYCSIRIEKGKSSKIKTHPPVSPGDFQDAERRHFLVSFVTYFYTFLYRRSFLQEFGIRFPNTYSCEDSAFLAACLLSARKIVQIDSPLYTHFQRQQSLSSKKDPQRYLQKLISFEYLLSFAQKHGLYAPYQQEIDFMYLKKAYLMACKTYVDNEDKPSAQILNDLSEGLETTLPDYRKNIYLRKTLKAKLGILLIRHWPHLACLVLRRIYA